eukprot:1157510-Pelagomonas_calceolata.AAC.21
MQACARSACTGLCSPAACFPTLASRGLWIPDPIQSHRGAQPHPCVRSFAHQVVSGVHGPSRQGQQDTFEQHLLEQLFKLIHPTKAVKPKLNYVHAVLKPNDPSSIDLIQYKLRRTRCVRPVKSPCQNDQRAPKNPTLTHDSKKCVA